MLVLIDEEQCVACGVCVDVCPEDALVLNPGDSLPVWIQGPCTRCNDCALECPTGAVVVQTNS